MSLPYRGQQSTASLEQFLCPSSEKIGFSCFGERGRLDRHFRRLAENPCCAPQLTKRSGQNQAQTVWRDASQGDRDGRAPKSACIVPD
jgi:hypothetical protein